MINYINNLILLLNMVKQITKKNKTYYICPECNFAYKEKETAAKCEAWCKEYKSCNVEITKHAVNF